MLGAADCHQTGRRKLRASHPRPSVSHPSRVSQLPIEATHAGRERKRTREESPSKARPRRKRSSSPFHGSGPELPRDDSRRRRCHEKRRSGYAIHRGDQKEGEHKDSVSRGEPTVGIGPIFEKVGSEELVPPLPIGGRQQQRDDLPATPGSSPPQLVCRLPLARIRPPVIIGDAPVQLPETVFPDGERVCGPASTVVSLPPTPTTSTCEEAASPDACAPSIGTSATDDVTAHFRGRWQIHLAAPVTNLVGVGGSVRRDSRNSQSVQIRSAPSVPRRYPLTNDIRAASDQ